MTITLVDDFSSYVTNFYGNAGPDSIRPGSGSRWSVKMGAPEISKQADQKWRFRHASSSGAYASTARAAGPLHAAVHFEAEITSGSTIIAIGFGDDRTHAAMDAYTRQLGGFYVIIEDGAMPGTLSLKAYHGVPTNDAGGIQNYLLYETLFSKVVGRNRFDFCVEIVETEAAIQLHSVMPGSEHPPEELLFIVTDINAYDTGYQMLDMKYLHILSKVWSTDVISYRPDERTAYPMGDVDIIPLPFGPDLAAGPADDATGITVDGDIGVEVSLSESLTPGSEIVGVGIVARYAPDPSEAGYTNPVIEFDTVWGLDSIALDSVGPGDIVRVYSGVLQSGRDLSVDEINALVMRARSSA